MFKKLYRLWFGYENLQFHENLKICVGTLFNNFAGKCVQ